MSEQKLQKKILDRLDAAGFYSFKVIVANKKGILDIAACAPGGRFIAIEVKFGYNKASKLQEYNIKRVRETGGVALLVWSLEELVQQLKNEGYEV